MRFWHEVKREVHRQQSQPACIVNCLDDLTKKLNSIQSMAAQSFLYFTMPIFSHRSVRRMLDELSPSLAPNRVRELEGKLRSQSSQTVPAEWEIAIGFALSKVGKIVDPGELNAGNPDFIFIPKDCTNQIIVEVTSLSDWRLDAENPVGDFSHRLHAISSKEGIAPILGSLNWRLGDMKVNGRIALGIPKRSDMDAFFKSAEFKHFLTRIKQEPSVSAIYRFNARNIDSEITFLPGQLNSSGQHASYKVASDLEDTGVFNRLKSKEKQISKSKLDLPSIVFLCDNDSHVLHHSEFKPQGIYGIDEFLSAFLDGRPHVSVGPWVFQEKIERLGKRIHAVITLTVHQPYAVFYPKPQRRLRGRVVPAATCDPYIKSSEFLQLMNQAVDLLPPPVATSDNAMRNNRWPAYFGGGVMTMNKVKISLLTLQKLMTGEFSQAEFVNSHGEIAAHMKRLTKGGLMISNITIEKQTDTDDDWVAFEFDNIQPPRLFDR